MIHTVMQRRLFKLFEAIGWPKDMNTGKATKQNTISNIPLLLDE